MALTMFVPAIGGRDAWKNTVFLCRSKLDTIDQIDRSDRQMANIEQLEAFVATARKGSFSAAARHLGKAQSTISSSVINLEIEVDFELFDRSKRNPTLTEAGSSLLADAEYLLRGHGEFAAHAASLSTRSETHLCVAIEQSVWSPAFLPILADFDLVFPYVTLELLDPGSSDVGQLVRDGRADIGVMIAPETLPRGFHFKGIGHSHLITVCSPDHPLARRQPVTELALRQFRQLIPHSRNPDDDSHLKRKLSPRAWLLESPHVTVDLVCAGIGWARLNEAVVDDELKSKALVALDLSFEKADVLQGVDVVCSQARHPGPAGHWLLQRLEAISVRRT